MRRARVLKGLLKFLREARIHPQQDPGHQRRFRVRKQAIDMGESLFLEVIQGGIDRTPARARQDRHFGAGHIGMDMLGGQIIPVREIFVFRRSLQTAAQPQDIAVAEGLIVGHARQQQAVGGQVAIARIHAGDFQAQVGVIVAVIRWFDESARDKHVVIPVVIKGNVEGVKTGDGVLISCGAEEQRKEQYEEKRRDEKGQRRAAPRKKT